MSDFFGNLNFTRMVILPSLLGSAALGYVVWNMQENLKALEQQVDTDAPLLVNKIQQLAVNYDYLQDQLDRDKFVTLDDPEKYIRDIATQDQVSIGDVNIAPTDKSIGGNVTDYKYRIEPVNKRREYELDFVSNFLYRLEEKSRRVKVTQLKLDPVERMKPHEVGKRRNWTFSATLTSRQADDEKE